MRLSWAVHVWEGRLRAVPCIGRSLFLAALLIGMIALSTPAAIVRAASAPPPTSIAALMPSRVTACSRASLHVATVYHAHALGQPSGTAMADAGDHPIHDATVAAGNAAAITDPRGGVTTYQYDPNQNLVRSTDATHHTTAYGYDADNERTTITRPDGTTLATGYDANGNVITTTDALSRTTVSVYDALNQRVGTTDSLGRTTASYDLAGNRTSAIDALGRTTVYTYDAANQQTAVQRPDGGALGVQYDLEGQVITRTDALTHSTGDTYDSLHRLVSVTDPLNRTTTYGYDLAGNRTSTTDPRADTTAYGYDAANERMTTTRADGGVWQTSYDANGNPVARTDPRTNTTTDSYDALDRLIATTDALAHTTSYQYDAVGNRTLLTDANSHSTAYQYDALNRVITTTDALSNTTVYGYDAVGNRTLVTDANNHSTRYGYDAGDEQTAITRTDGTTATTGYDLAGNVVTRTSGLGHSTTYGYDLLDRPITVTDPLAGTTVYGYDLAGNRTLMADPLGRTTVYTYDAADQQTAVGQADGSTLTTAYDLSGNPITATDALGQQTIYGYDSLDRVITTTDPLGRSTYASYDLAGNRTSRTDALGRVTTYGYDALDRPSAITYSDGATPNVRYTYTATGQRRSMTDGTGLTTYGYDALDRPITVTNGAGHSVGYGYDAVGNTTALTYPDGSQVTRTYDTLDRLNSVHDWLGHTARFGYDADNPITETLPTTTATSIVMGYDAADRLAGITDTTPLTTWSFAYTRDKSGEITAAIDPLDGHAHRYSYDKLAGLIADSQGTGTITNTVGWANDAAREVTQRLDPAGPYTSTLTYDNAHELTGTTTLSGTAILHNLSFVYNKNGDRTSQTDSVSGAKSTFGYDQADRLITATIGITTSSYSYDGDGLRQSKTVTTTQGTTTTAETWDSAEGLPALLQDGGTRYVMGPDGLPIEQVNADGSVQYYLRDQLGSTRALLDSAGHTVATDSYDAYGNPTGRTDSATTPFGYAGEYTDAETGFQYLRARYYDPATQQFVSVDPLVDQTGQPYAYVADDPLNMIDPTGLCPSDGFCPWEAVGQATGAALGAVGGAAHTGYDFATSTGGSFARTIGTGAVGTYYSLAEAARLIPLTCPFMEGGVRPYLLHASGDLADAAVTANHLDIAWNLVSQSAEAPFKAALACPSATTIGNATGDTLGTLALLFGPAKAAGLVGRTGIGARLSATSRVGSLGDLIEANAQRRLATMEAATPKAHFLSRHGAQTTLDQQYTRAQRGLTPDGYAGEPVNSTRFLSHQAQLNAIQRAQTIAIQTGQKRVDVDMGYTIGEGFDDKSLGYWRTTNARVVFKNGMPYTAYPYLGPVTK